MNIFFIIISAILYAASFPKLEWWWLAFVSLVPFFWALDNADSGFKNFVYGILWGAGHAFGMGYWVFFTVLNHYEVLFAKSVLFFSLCLVLPLVILYSAFAVVYRFLHGHHLFFYALVAPSLWVLAEFLKSVFSFLIPWGAIEYALVPFTTFIQIADIAGGYGVMFLAVAVNSLFVYVIKQFNLFPHRRISQCECNDHGECNDHDQHPDHGKGQDRGNNHQRSVLNAFFAMGLIVLFVAGPAVYGGYRLQQIEKTAQDAVKAGNSVQAVLVQGNFSTKERWSGMGFYQRIKSYLELSGGAAFEPQKKMSNEKAGPTDKPETSVTRQVIVWPETILNSSSELDDEFFVEIMRYIGKNTLLISGGLKTDHEQDAVYNSAYFISGAGRLLRYDKHILLPYAETSPLIDLLDTYYNAPTEFRSGQTPVSIDAPGGMAGTSICFEILYSGFIRQSVKDGAVYLVNISNDSWFGDSPMPYIHLNAARLRAIENRRFLLRASNSGISAVIAPTGEIAARSGLFTKERVEGEFIKTDRFSFYTCYGNLILAISVVILFAALIQLVIRKE